MKKPSIKALLVAYGLKYIGKYNIRGGVSYEFFEIENSPGFARFIVTIERINRWQTHIDIQFGIIHEKAAEFAESCYLKHSGYNTYALSNYPTEIKHRIDINYLGKNDATRARSHGYNELNSSLEENIGVIHHNIIQCTSKLDSEERILVGLVSDIDLFPWERYSCALRLPVMIFLSMKLYKSIEFLVHKFNEEEVRIQSSIKVPKDIYIQNCVDEYIRLYS